MGHPIAVARSCLANLHPIQKRPAISHYLNARQHERPRGQLSGKAGPVDVGFFRDHPTQDQEPQLYFHFIVGEQKELLDTYKLLKQKISD